MVDQRIDKVSKTNFELKIDITRLSAHLFTHTHILHPKKLSFCRHYLDPAPMSSRRRCTRAQGRLQWAGHGLCDLFSIFVNDFELATRGRAFLDNFVNGGRVEVAWLELNTWIWRADSLQQNRFCFFVQNVRHRWFYVQVTQLRSEADKGPRPDGGFMEKDINSTICVPVVQLAENTSKQHFSHNRVEQIV